MASAVVTPYDNDRDIPELLVITSSAEINGSLFTDTIVHRKTAPCRFGAALLVV
jgi:hypothetical protein